MPPRPSATAMSSAFNLNSLLHNLPLSLSKHPESFTKCSACLFSTSSAAQSFSSKKVKRRVDPYRIAQANQRKAANLEKQKVLREQRQAATGDPVRSTPTPFVESLRNSSSTTTTSSSEYLNFYLKQEDVQSQLSHSKWLTEPLPKTTSDAFNDIVPNEDPRQFARQKSLHEYNHDNAVRAISAIASLDNGSSKDRTRINIQRCIEEFGRHNTDQILAPKPVSAGRSTGSESLSVADDLQPSSVRSLEAEAAMQDLAALPKRAGPDTGSSEVQAAILTAKINVLADSLGKKDKHNKRNLRLLVHRRQKLLAYLRRKERGGPRWQHLVEKLGIGDAMWKGEISL